MRHCRCVCILPTETFGLAKIRELVKLIDLQRSQEPRLAFGQILLGQSCEGAQACEIPEDHQICLNSPGTDESNTPMAGIVTPLFNFTLGMLAVIVESEPGVMHSPTTVPFLYQLQRHRKSVMNNQSRRLRRKCTLVRHGFRPNEQLVIVMAIDERESRNSRLFILTVKSNSQKYRADRLTPDS